MVFHGVTIERNARGYFVAWLDYAGLFVQCDTLAACKKRILQDQEKQKKLTCRY